MLTVVSCGGSDDNSKKDAAAGGGIDGPTSVVSVTASTATLPFGNVQQGATSAAPLSVTVTNKGTSAVSLSPSITGVAGEFTITSTTCASLAAAPGTCTISVSFTPQALGSRNGTLNIAGAVIVSLTGTGTAPASFTVTDAPLGTVSAGAVISGKVNVIATTALTDLICTAVGGDVVLDLTATTGACTGVLAANATCSVSFKYTAPAATTTGDKINCNAGGVTANGGNITATIIQPAKLTIAPTAGAVTATIGDTAAIIFTISNSGGLASGALTGAIPATSTEFTVGASTCASGATAGSFCTIAVNFKPTTAGTKTATLTVTDATSATTTLSATITGVANTAGNLSIVGTADFGSVAVGTTGTPVVFTLKNTGGEPASAVSVVTSNAQFAVGDASDTCKGQTLAATTGACTFTVTFVPTTLGAVSGVISANATGAITNNFAVTGTGVKAPTLTITPSPLAFNGISLNTKSADQTLTVTNTGAASTGLLTLPTGLGAGFVMSGNTCSAALEAGASCTIAINFTPGVIEQVSYTLNILSVSGATGSVVLTGTGKQPNVLSLSPSDVKACSTSLVHAAHTGSGTQCFSNTAVGESDGSFPKLAVGSPVSFTVTNSGTASNGGINLESGLVTVTIGGANASDFVIAKNNCTASLQPSQTCVFTVSFSPTAVGARTATISVTSTNGGNVGTNISAVGLAAIEIQPCGASSASATPPFAGLTPGSVSSANAFANKASCSSKLADATLNPSDNTGLDFGQVSIGADCVPTNVKWFLVTVNSSTAADYRNLISTILTDTSAPNNFRIVDDSCNNFNELVSTGPAQCWVSVQFRPQGTTQDTKTATIAAKGGSGGSASLALTGSATGVLTIQPSTNDFGTVVVNEAAGASGTLSLTVTNWGSTKALGPVSATLSGNTGDFRLIYDNCTGSTLSAAGGTCQLAVNSSFPYITPNNGACVVAYRFFPAAVGSRTATFTAVAGGVTSTATLHGTGVAETTISASPTAAAFGNIVLSNKSDWQTITVTAGSGSVETGNLEFIRAGVNLEQFEIGTAGDAGTCGDSGTIRIGGGNAASCTIKVRFIPRGNSGDGRASGLGLQQATLVISDPRDRTLTQKIPLTGTGTSQLTITPTSADFGIKSLGYSPSTVLTFTVTNGGADTIATPTLAVTNPFKSVTGTTTCNTGTLSAGSTCIVAVNWNPSAGYSEVAGIINANPGVQLTTTGNDSEAVATISATVQTPAQLELVGLLSGSQTAANFGKVIDLGSAAVGGTGGRATLLFRNSGGHATGTLKYYFWDGITAGTAPAAGVTTGRLAANTADANFAVVAGDPAADACVGKVLKGGAYCIVQVDFLPTVRGRSSTIKAGFELLGMEGSVNLGGTVRAVTFAGNSLDTSIAADQFTITPAFASLIASPVAFTSSSTTATTFTIKNESQSATKFTAAVSAGYSISANTCTAATLGDGSTAGFSLAGAATCYISVKFAPTTGSVKSVYWTGALTITADPAQSATLQTTAFTAGLMGKVLEGTVLKVWDPATGTNFGSVARAVASAPMAFQVMNIGDAATTGNISLSIAGTTSAQFGVTGCDTTLAAFVTTSPSTAASCTGSVVLTPTIATVGTITGATLVATAAGIDDTGTAGTISSDDSSTSSSTISGTCITPAALGILPTGTYTFSDVQSIGTVSAAEALFTVTNGSDPSSLTPVADFQTTSAITISLSDSTNFVLDLNPTTAVKYADGTTPVPSCQLAEDQVTGQLILQGNLQCTLGVKFAPQALPTTGTAFSTILTATAATGGTKSVTIKGTGRDDLVVTTTGSSTTVQTTAIAFSSTVVGKTSSELSVYILNTGATASGILSTAFTGDFFITMDTCQGTALAASNGRCYVTLKFAPTATGARTGTVTVTGTPGGTATIGLTGTGS